MHIYQNSSLAELTAKKNKKVPRKEPETRISGNCASPNNRHSVCANKNCTCECHKRIFKSQRDK